MKRTFSSSSNKYSIFKISCMSFVPERPLGVTVVGILEAIVGIFSISIGLVLTTGGAGVGNAKLSSDMGGFTVITLALGLLALVICYGVWTRRRWAWPYAVMIAGLGVLTNATTAYFFGSTFSVLDAGMQLLVIYYLTRPNVKAFFPKLYPTPGKSRS